MSFYITTPIYYVNARPHLGHAYTTIVADSLRRFHQMLGEDTRFLTGTDEHGDKIAQAAEAAGMTPQAFVDSISRQFQGLWPQLQVEPDQFIRTTDPEHIRTVQAFLQKIYDTGDIYFGEFGGHYCYGCERFYTEKELEDGLCPQHRTKPQFIQERNYFFRMSKYLPWLQDYIRSSPDFIRPERYRNEVLAMLEGGVLEDLCISRPKSRLSWGIELPFDKEYVCYVWFDALLNYISASGWPDGENYKRFWPGEHLVAKDILKPHAIFWPTMLKSANMPLYRHLNVHGYWLSRNAKMSKSLGNVVEPLEMASIYGVDAFRYFLLREMHFGSDAGFSEEALVSRLNADLANDLGNLFSRVLSMTAKYFAGCVPPVRELSEEDAALMSLAENSQRNFVQLFGEVRFAQALEALWELVRALNKYVDVQAPWTLAKQGHTERLGTVIRLLLECMRKIACFLWPVMPGAATSMLAQLGVPVSEKRPKTNLLEEVERWNVLVTGSSVASSSNLFPRVDLKAAERAGSSRHVPAEKTPKVSKPAGKEPPKAGEVETPPSEIAFSDFQKLELRVGTVLSCEKHPKADKLLVFKVDLGEAEPRQILSGIAEHFQPETLTGKQVCVVSNLAARTIRGMVSQGMILTSEDAAGLGLLCPAREMAPGSRIS